MALVSVTSPKQLVLESRTEQAAPGPAQDRAPLPSNLKEGAKLLPNSGLRHHICKMDRLSWKCFPLLPFCHIWKKVRAGKGRARHGLQLRANCMLLGRYLVCQCISFLSLLSQITTNLVT